MITSWWRQLRAARRRILTEDALKHLYACEVRGGVCNLESMSGALRRSPRAVLRLLGRMESQGLARSKGHGFELTEPGRGLAIQIVRAHRLWERYLADEAQLSLAEVHAVADRREHKRDDAALQALDAALGHPETDPHGDPIPSADGSIRREPRTVLTDWPVGVPCEVAHVEDEPAEAMSKLLKLGVVPGVTLEVMERSGEELQFTIDGELRTMSPTLSGNVHVRELHRLVEERLRTIRLSQLPLGWTARVSALDETCRGFTRRRLLDLGLTAGTEIAVELANAGQSARAYRVRGTLIALRRNQSDQVHLEAGSLQPDEAGNLAGASA